MTTTDNVVGCGWQGEWNFSVLVIVCHLGEEGVGRRGQTANTCFSTLSRKLPNHPGNGAPQGLLPHGPPLAIMVCQTHTVSARTLLTHTHTLSYKACQPFVSEAVTNRCTHEQSNMNMLICSTTLQQACQSYLQLSLKQVF